MKKLLLICAVVIACAPCFADGWDTKIEWGKWKIESSECLFLGSTHTSYPLTHLVDGDMRTAWVFSGKRDLIKEQRRYGKGPVQDFIVISGKITADSVWIMNGYNRSPELFRRNNRITQVQVFLDGKPVKTADLSDKMGWHKIAIPRKQAGELKLLFTGISKGRDDDTCVSELALYDGKRRIDWGLPKLVLFSPGSDCGCGADYALISHSGKKFIAWDSESADAWSPSQKLLAIAETTKKGRIWIRAIDVVKGKTVFHRATRYRYKDRFGEHCNLTWKSETSLLVTVHDLGSGEHKFLHKQTVRVL